MQRPGTRLCEVQGVGLGSGIAAEWQNLATVDSGARGDSRRDEAHKYLQDANAVEMEQIVGCEARDSGANTDNLMKRVSQQDLEVVQCEAASAEEREHQAIIWRRISILDTGSLHTRPLVIILHYGMGVC